MELHSPVRCVIFGAGGHARVLIDALCHGSGAIPYALLDQDSNRWGKELLGVPIRGGDDKLQELIAEEVTYFVLGLGGTGDNRPRARLFEFGLVHGLRPLTVRHPASIFSPSAEIGDGSVQLAGAIVNAGAKVGANVIINTGAIVEHDCVIGDHAHIATGARLASTVRVENGAHIGIGATIRQSITIGEGAVVGAGAVVVEDVARWTVVVGVPAHLISTRTNI